MWSLRIFFEFLFVLLIWSAVAIQANPVDQKAQTADKPLVNTAPVTKDPKCLLPKDSGPCRMGLTRFYYDAKTDSCEEFTFGGCRGNDNKFGFKETCEKECKTGEIPSLSLKPSTLKSLAYSPPVTQKAEVTTVTTPKPQKAVKN